MIRKKVLGVDISTRIKADNIAMAIYLEVLRFFSFDHRLDNSGISNNLVHNLIPLWYSTSMSPSKRTQEEEWLISRLPNEELILLHSCYMNVASINYSDHIKKTICKLHEAAASASTVFNINRIYVDEDSIIEPITNTDLEEAVWHLSVYKDKVYDDKPYTLKEIINKCYATHPEPKCEYTISKRANNNNTALDNLKALLEKATEIEAGVNRKNCLSNRLTINVIKVNIKATLAALISSSSKKLIADAEKMSRLEISTLSVDTIDTLNAEIDLIKRLTNNDLKNLDKCLEQINDDIVKKNYSMLSWYAESEARLFLATNKNIVTKEYPKLYSYITLERSLVGSDVSDEDLVRKLVVSMLADYVANFKLTMWKTLVENNLNTLSGENNEQ